MEKDKRECAHCGTPLVGRADKKFCSDQCRATAGNHRKLTDAEERELRDINNILRQNRNVLRQASPQGKTTVRRQVLEMAGFNFRYFTHQYRTRQGNLYNFCYNYGYMLLPEEKVLIVYWQSYMKYIVPLCSS